VTEISDGMALTPLEQRFVLHWGEMGARWGLNRTVAQIHALLYLSPHPLPADAICELLDVARSNVSTSLRELQAWGVIRLAHVLGDRRDHFEALSDVWSLFRRVLDERKRREIDPTLEFLRQCVKDAESSGESARHTRARLAEMRDFFETVCRWYDDFRDLPPERFAKFVKLRNAIQRLLGDA
jgi:DNA-binding transcriptional regulator GbsR (MarR family)